MNNYELYGDDYEERRKKVRTELEAMYGVQSQPRPKSQTPSVDTAVQAATQTVGYSADALKSAALKNQAASKLAQIAVGVLNPQPKPVEWQTRPYMSASEEADYNGLTAAQIRLNQLQNAHNTNVDLSQNPVAQRDAAWKNYRELEKQAAQVQQQIDELLQAKKKAERQNQISQMEAVKANSDFLQTAQQGAQGTPTYEQLQQQYSSGYEAGRAGAVDNTVYFDWLNRESHPNTAKFASQLSKSQMDIYNYYYARYGKQKADEYLELLQPELSEKSFEESVQKINNEMPDWYRTILPVLTDMFAPFAWAENAVNAARGADTDVNQGAVALTRLGDYAQQKTLENAGGTGQFFGNVLYSMANMATKLPFGPVGGLAYMSTSAAGHTTADALEKGADPNTAFLLGTLSGVTEFATEKLPLDHLFRVARQGGRQSLRQAVSATLKQAGMEGTEEAVSEYANVIYDMALQGERSDFMQYKKALMEQGLSEAEAERQARLKFFVENPFLSAMGGAVSGGTFGAGATTLNALNNGMTLRTTRTVSLPDGTKVRMDPNNNPVSVVASNGKEVKLSPHLGVDEAIRHVQLSAENPQPFSAPQSSPQMGVAQSGAVSPANANSALVGNTEAGRTAVNTNLDGHTPQEQRTIKEYNSFGDQKLIQYIQKVRNGLAGKKELFYLKKTSDRMAKDLKELTGLDVSENKIALAPNTIEHIDKNHGINGKRDSSMADDADLSRIQYVLDNYDEVHLNTDKSRGYSLSNGKPAPMVVFEKRIDGSYYVVEAISDANAKTNYIVSAFKRKVGATPYGNLGKIKETGRQPSDVQAPEITSENATGIPVSNNIIPTSAQKSNAEHVVYPQRSGAPGKVIIPGIVQTKSRQGAIVWSETEKDSVSNPVNAFEKKWGIESKVVKPSVKTNVAAFVKDGKIYLNADKIDSYSGAVSKLAHEAAHIVEGSEYWAEMKKAAAAYYRAVDPNLRPSVMREAIRERYKGVAELTVDQAAAEVVAGFMEDICAQNSLVGERAARILLEESPKGFQRVVEFLKDKVESLKAYLPVGTGLSKQQRYELQAAQRGLRNLERGLEAYRKGKAEAERGTRYAVTGNYDYIKSFAEQVDDYKQGKIPKGDTLLVCPTPEVLQKIGLNPLPMTINTTHVDYALNGTKDVNHSLGQALISQLPTAIQNPAAVISSQTQGKTSLVVLLPIQHLGNTVIAPVYIDGFGRQNGIVIDSNAITSVFGKRNAVTKLLRDAIQEERNGNTAVFYYNKKIADPLLQVAGLQLPGGLIPRGGYIHSIRENGSKINLKFKNITETQQFKRWFGDWEKHPNTASKVVDKNGAPLVVYHGTPNSTFTVFDSGKRPGGKKTGSLGDGYYFAADGETARQFMGEENGRVIQAYLSIKKPYYTLSRWFNGEMLSQMAWDVAKQNGGKLDPAKGYPTNLQQVQQFLKNYGYDGIIRTDYDGEMNMAVAFEPNQIKSATDNIGTYDPNNPDIRYSYGDGSFTDYYLDYANRRYGTIPKGEKAYREISVPRQTGEGTKTRRAVRTILEAESTPDSAVEAIKKDLAKEAYAYTPEGDKAALDRAGKTIRTRGLQGALDRWNAAVNGAEPVGKEMMALGETLMAEAGKSGDIELFQKLAAEIAAEATNAGQAVQAMKLIKKFTPEGQLYYVQKAVDGLQKKLNRRMKGKAPELELDPELAKKLLEARTAEEMETASMDILKSIAEQMPSTWQDKWDAWRYFAMLANPRTHIRNILGNTVFVPARMMKNGAVMLAERMVSPKERTQAFLTKVDQPLREFAQQNFETVKDSLTSTGKMNPSNIINELRPIFTSKAFAWLEKLRKLNNRALEAEDLFFLKRAYVSSMAKAMKARGLDVDFLQSGTREATVQLRALEKLAAQEALEATYRDASSTASALNHFKETNKATDIIGNALFPFTKTPVNVLKRGVEYSPIGLIKGVVDMTYGLKTGKKTAAEAIGSLCKGVSGLGIAALGYWLSSMGLLVAGAPEDDRERSFETLQGAKTYALKLGDVYYTIDWMAPVALPLFVGAEMQKATEGEGFSTANIIDSLTKISEPMFNLSMLDGLNSTFKSISYGSAAPLADFAVNAAKDYITQALPTLGGQIARTIDPKARNSYYVDKNSPIPESVQELLNAAQAKIPFLSFFLSPKVDQWGRTTGKDNALVRAFENFISPGYISTRNETPVDKEIAKVYKETGESKVLPRTADKHFEVDGETRRLSAQEYTKYAQERGKRSFEYINQLLSNPGYQKLGPDEKAEVIQEMYQAANAEAKKEVDPDYDIPNTVVKAYEANKQAGILYGDYYLYKMGLESTPNQQEVIDALNRSGLTRAQKRYLFHQRFPNAKQKPFG